MQRLIMVMLFVILLCVSMSACNGVIKTTNKQSSGNTNALLDKDNQSKNTYSNEMITKQNSNSDDTKSVKEEFYGEWIINRQIAMGRVVAYGDEDVKRLVGKKITYSPDLASYNDTNPYSDIITKNPYYEISNISEKDFFADFYVSLERLGINGKSIIKVEVYTDKEFKHPWHNAAGKFYIKDQNTLIFNEGGIYFELVRT
jgi:hypothetical protein